MAFGAFLSGVIGALWRERRYSAQQLHKYRDKQLQKLVRHAHANSPFWRARLENVDLDKPVNLAQIEPVTKAELMDALAESIVDNSSGVNELEGRARDPSKVGHSFGKGLVLATTSGTTGRIGYFVKSVRDLTRMNGILTARIFRDRLIPRELLRFAFGRRYRMAMVIATGGHFISHILGGFRPWSSRAFIDLRTFSIMDQLDQVVCDLNRFRPHYLHGYPTFLEALAHEKLQGRLAIDPEFISLGSEPFSLTARRAIVSAFPRAQISETYGTTECLAIANQCSAGHLHVNEDVVILEPVDSQGRPVAIGVPSAKVLITNLASFAQPVLRYELSDSVIIEGKDCPCGSPMMRIRVEGRSDDTLYLEDDREQFQAFPPVPFEALMLGVDGLKQYQLVHREQNNLQINVVREEATEGAELAERIKNLMTRFFGGRGITEKLNIDVQVVEEIHRDPVSHKVRQIYSEVPRPDRCA